MSNPASTKPSGQGMDELIAKLMGGKPAPVDPGLERLFELIGLDDAEALALWIELDRGRTAGDVLFKGRAPLAWAANRNAPRCAALLIDHFGPEAARHKRHAMNVTPLGEALLQSSFDVVQVLAQHSPREDFQGPYHSMTSMAAMASGDSGPCLAWALAQEPGAAMACSGPRQMTPLMAACSTGRREAMLALLPLSDPRARNPEGIDALMCAAHAGFVEGVQAMIPRCDPMNRDKRGRSALMRAFHMSSVECIALLLPVSDLDAVDAKGRGPLELFEDFIEPEKEARIRDMFAAERRRREALAIDGACGLGTPRSGPMRM